MNDSYLIWVIATGLPNPAYFSHFIVPLFYGKFLAAVPERPYGCITVDASIMTPPAVNELLGHQKVSSSFIIEYLASLMQSIKELNPILIYLTQPDVHETILRAANERRLPDKILCPDWIDHVIKYVSNSIFGMENRLHGFEGAVRYFERRKEIELEVIRHLDIRTIIIENSDYDTEKGIANVIEALVEL